MLYTQRYLEVIIKWCRYCSIKGSISTFKVDIITTLYRQRHHEIIIKWCRYYSTKGPMLTLRVNIMTTLCKMRQKEAMTKWCRCCLIKDPISMLEVNIIATLYSCEVYRVPVWYNRASWSAFSLSFVFFWWIVTLLFSLYKIFSSFFVNSITIFLTKNEWKILYKQVSIYFRSFYFISRFFFIFFFCIFIFYI